MRYLLAILIALNLGLTYGLCTKLAKLQGHVEQLESIYLAEPSWGKYVYPTHRLVEDLWLELVPEEYTIFDKKLYANDVCPH